VFYTFGNFLFHIFIRTKKIHIFNKTEHISLIDRQKLTTQKKASSLTMTTPQAPSKPIQLFHGIVKQVNSGDSLIIRSAVAGKNLEKQIILAQINSARLGRNLRDNQAEPDQPYAFEAREFLRKKCVGKEVVFAREATTSTGTDRGTLYLGKDVQTGENLNEAIIAAGLVEVRRLNKPSEEESRLVALEEQAKSAGLGKWSKDLESEHVRNVKYTLDNAKTFFC